jgi:hypothetical protein
LRQEVLEGLGWTIHRIWSTDWFKQPERELKRVVEAIERAKVLSKSLPAKKDSKDIQDIQRDESLEKQMVKQHVSDVVPYQIAKLTIELGEREFHTLPISMVASWVSQIVRVESPVHVSEVMKRICDAAGIMRVGNRIQETIVRSFAIQSDIRRKEDFLWFKDMKVPILRDRSDPNLNKKVQFIAAEEIAQAVLKVVKDSYGVEVDHVATSAFQAIGFARVTDEMKERIKPIIDDLIQNGVLIDKGKVLVLA